MHKHSIVSFDNQPSLHKTGILSHSRNKLNIVCLHHCAESFANIYAPSSEVSISFSNPSVVQTIFVEFLSEKISRNIAEKITPALEPKSILFVASILSPKLIFFMWLIARRLNTKLLPAFAFYLEPLRLGDLKSIIRVLRFYLCTCVAWLLFRDIRVYTTSSLNMFVYKAICRTKVIPYSSIHYPLPDLIKPKKTTSLLPGHPLKIIFVGKVDRRKNLKCIFKALSLVKIPYALTVIGACNYSYTRELNRLAQKHRIKNNISFIGQVTHSEMISKYQNSHLLVLPSVFDGYGFVARESLSMGLYTIVSNRCGSSDLSTFFPDRFFTFPSNYHEFLARLISIIYYSMVI